MKNRIYVKRKSVLGVKLVSKIKLAYQSGAWVDPCNGWYYANGRYYYRMYQGAGDATYVQRVSTADMQYYPDCPHPYDLGTTYVVQPDGTAVAYREVEL